MDICRRRDAGMEIARIAEDMGLGYKTVFMALKQEGRTRTYKRSKDRHVSHVEGEPETAKPPRGMDKLNARRADIVVWIERGWTARRMIAEVGVAEDTLRRWMLLNDLTLRPEVRFTPLQQRIIDTWKTTNLNRAAIARELQCSKHVVSRTLDKAGLVKRGNAIGRPTGARKHLR